MSHSVLSGGQFSGGSWHPGMGAAPADKGYKGPNESFGAEAPTWQKTFAGEQRQRGNTQSADPTIKDKANRRNVLTNTAERSGPAGVVSCGRSYSGASTHTDTGRNVRIMPSRSGPGDTRRGG